MVRLEGERHNHEGQLTTQFVDAYDNASARTTTC